MTICISADTLMMIGLGLITLSWLVWLGRLPEEDFDAPPKDPLF